MDPHDKATGHRSDQGAIAESLNTDGSDSSIRTCIGSTSRPRALIDLLADGIGNVAANVLVNSRPGICTVELTDSHSVQLGLNPVGSGKADELADCCWAMRSNLNPISVWRVLFLSNALGEIRSHREY